MKTPDTETEPTLKSYKVGVFTTLFVKATSKEKALDIAHDALIGSSIKVREFDLEVEEWED